MDLDRAHRIMQLPGVVGPTSGGRERREQAVDRGEQEVPRAEGRLEDAPGVQRPVGGVAGEVEQRGDHLGPREHGAAPGLPLIGEARQGSP